MDQLESLAITPDGVDWDAAGLRRPAATWTYLVGENPFGASGLVSPLGRTGMAAASLGAPWLVLLHGVTVLWARRRRRFPPRRRAESARPSRRPARGLYSPTVAIFASDAKTVLKRLADKSYETSQERDQLLAQLATAEGLRARDVVWMLFRPDRSYRDAALPLLRRLADPETVDVVIAECHAKPEAAVRAAAATLFSLGHPRHGAAPGDARGVGQGRDPGDRPQAAARGPGQPRARARALAARRRRAVSRSASRSWAGSPRGRSTPGRSRAGSAWRATPSKAIREKALAVLVQHDLRGSVELFVEQIPLVGYSTQQQLVEALTRAAAGQGAAFADRVLPLMASGDAGTRSAVLKILLGMADRAQVVRRYIVFSKTLAGWARDRALESMRAFGPDLLEPTIELLSDPDEEVRASAMLVAQSFEDPRIVPATIGLLKDPDWWIRITAAETLGRLKDPRAVAPLVEALADPETRWSAVEALGRIADLRAAPALSQLLSDPAPEVRIEVLQALSHFEHPQMLDFVRNVAKQDSSRAVRARALEIAREMAARRNTTLADEDALRQAALVAKSGAGEPRLNALLVATRNAGASDFHLAVGQPPTLRLAADLVKAQGESFTAEQTAAMIDEILSEAQWERLAEGAPARLLPLHRDRRPLPRQRLRRPEGHERRLPRDPGAAAHDRRDRPAAAPRRDRRLPPGPGARVRALGLGQVDDARRARQPVQRDAARPRDHARGPGRVRAPVQELPGEPARGGQRHAVLRARAARRAARGPRRDRDRRAARHRERLAGADRGRDRPHRARHAQLDLGARRRSTASSPRSPSTSRARCARRSASR